MSWVSVLMEVAQWVILVVLAAQIADGHTDLHERISNLYLRFQEYIDADKKENQ